MGYPWHHLPCVRRRGELSLGEQAGLFSSPQYSYTVSYLSDRGASGAVTSPNNKWPTTDLVRDNWPMTFDLTYNWPMTLTWPVALVQRLCELSSGDMQLHKCCQHSVGPTLHPADWTTCLTPPDICFSLTSRNHQATEQAVDINLCNAKRHKQIQVKQR